MKTLTFDKHFKDFSPHAIRIMIKISFSALCLALFIQLTKSINHAHFLQIFDEVVLKWIEQLRTPFFNVMMLDITALGGLALTIVLGLLTVSLFILSKDYAAAIHLFITSSAGFFISTWSKNFVSRPRPNIIPQLIHASGFSYPSGHSITSSAIYLTMAILACRHYKEFSARIIILCLAGIMITLISFSRLYLGVHYPTDTISGTLLGSAWAFFMAALFSKTHFSNS